MSVTSKDCLVHNSKSSYQFYRNLNKLREKNQFNGSTFQILQNRYCKCYQQKEDCSFDVDHLEDICQEIESLTQTKKEAQSETSFDYLVLAFPLRFNDEERIHSIGSFIGQNGINIKKIQSRFHAKIYIVDQYSCLTFQKIVDKFKLENPNFKQNSLWILIKIKKEKISSQLIKQTLMDRWNRIITTDYNQQHSQKQFHEDQFEDFDVEKDSRWKPKKRR